MALSGGFLAAINQYDKGYIQWKRCKVGKILIWFNAFQDDFFYSYERF